jgi:hypothetical protein
VLASAAEDAATKANNMRSRVLQEIVVTETTYVNHLVNFRDLYVLPLQSKDAEWKQAFMRQSEIAVFFSNFEQIVHLNTQFLAEINRRVWAEYVRAASRRVSRLVVYRRAATMSLRL